MSGMVALATPDRRLRRNVIFTRIKVLLKDMLEQDLIESTGSTKGKMYKKINVN